MIRALVAIGLTACAAIDTPQTKETVVFGTSMKVIDRATNEVKNLEVKLTPDDSPIDVAKQIQAKFNIDFVTYRWLLRSFEHSFARLNEDEVAKVDVTIGEKKVTINLCVMNVGSRDIFDFTLTFLSVRSNQCMIRG